MSAGRDAGHGSARTTAIRSSLVEHRDAGHPRPAGRVAAADLLGGGPRLGQRREGIDRPVAAAVGLVGALGELAARVRSPVSSRTSRSIASAGLSFTSAQPPGSVQPPSERSRTSSTASPSTTTPRTFVPRMLVSGRDHRILITASLAGLATWPGGGPYAASKHAVVAVAEQAVLALAGDPITVTVLCPALVRTGMSDVGDDPADVAEAALDAVGRGRFAVLPDEWRGAVRERARRLTTGLAPEPPLPAP